MNPAVYIVWAAVATMVGAAVALGHVEFAVFVLFAAVVVALGIPADERRDARRRNRRDGYRRG